MTLISDAALISLGKSACKTLINGGTTTEVLIAVMDNIPSRDQENVIKTVGFGIVACQEDGTVVARFLPPSWDHLFSQSWDRPACCVGASFVSLFDHHVSVLGVEVNRDGFQGGQRG